jgi:hypothetical protein
VICPYCSATCRLDDGYCHACHRALPSGLRQSTVVSWSCGGGAILGVLLVFLAAPLKSGTGVAGALCVSIPVAFAGACVCGLMGWIIGRVVCEH